MPLYTMLTKQLDRALSALDERGTVGPRLVDDAVRLSGRLHAFVKMNFVQGALNIAAVEIACYAVQLPLRQQKLLPTGKLGRSNLKDRAEQASEMLVSGFADYIEAVLLNQTAELLQQLPQRAPTSDEARLLADIVNLDDFGITGLLHQTIYLCRSGGGVTQVADGLEKREMYGYWGARLKEGFHFEPVRKIARRRLENTRQAAALLLDEMREDRAL